MRMMIMITTTINSTTYCTCMYLGMSGNTTSTHVHIYDVCYDSYYQY